MIHRNAPLTPTGRLRLARCVVEDGWPVRRAAERFQVSHTTAARWAGRYRRHGETGMYDRSSRPARCPWQTPPHKEARVLRMRREHRIGPLRLAARTGVAASTAHRILQRHDSPALAVLDRATGEPVRRYERSRPGELIHVDVKKLGRIPDGGGHKVLGRAAGSPNKDRRHGMGYAYLHTALDDHSRLAYTEDLPDETAPTCADFLQRATAWFARQGVTVERVLTDNAWAYTKNTWRQTCHELGISPRWTRPWRPQTNGKVERFHRTLLDEWAYHQPYTSDAQRQAAFPDWLDWYNYHRPHTGISGHTPASRITNLPEQHT
ncbi:MULTISPECIES: IS481 family transposase [unclassified Streptomyces]|uniref:IS481 family transposase n=1 Tax=unclassified Streptomyces TaxID=2593676 RepID=UPI002DDBC48E|nr:MULTISPECIES: IS481 family transposase [unclassified Streptomyces]WSS46365.1 IS481 family transposase [Streptomyces sp. NBC_01187]WSA97799.1 IS481 family transposase [Streptomyces sp. NBC_01795]WSB81332.1 IS481 family transposase [Streptomyces sp. NBC_01775]WSB82203.1 IS481 family transposase [Streptomyces sp. NBC_01775]WSS17913.1 IS481 family transposase [Streptomyces sp. NBC_01186]